MRPDQPDRPFRRAFGGKDRQMYWGLPKGAVMATVGAILALLLVASMALVLARGGLKGANEAHRSTAAGRAGSTQVVSPSTTISPTPKGFTNPVSTETTGTSQVSFITSIQIAVDATSYVCSNSTSNSMQTFVYTATIHVAPSPNGRSIKGFFSGTSPAGFLGPAGNPPGAYVVPPNAMSISEIYSLEVNPGDPPGQYRMQFVVTSPSYVASNPATVTKTC